MTQCRTVVPHCSAPGLVDPPGTGSPTRAPSPSTGASGTGTTTGTVSRRRARPRLTPNRQRTRSRVTQAATATGRRRNEPAPPPSTGGRGRRLIVQRLPLHGGRGRRCIVTGPPQAQVIASCGIVPSEWTRAGDPGGSNRSGLSPEAAGSAEMRTSSADRSPGDASARRSFSARRGLRHPSLSAPGTSERSTLRP